MNGRLEKELRAEEKMKMTLMELPLVFTEFYYALTADGKSYTTLQNYINHMIHLFLFSCSFHHHT